MTTQASTPYNDQFYDAQRSGSLRSARKIVPCLLNWLPCQSVADFGCGVGTWLSVFCGQGIADVVGVDGDYVDQSRLLIPVAQFKPADLRQPVQIGRSFDLVTSLEVAEHLPADCAATFVETLTCHGDAVLFSAATPHQGGTEHLNEQWPAFWARLFLARGYVCFDFLRMQFWGDPDVEWWYAQNAMLFVNRSRLERFSRLPGRVPDGMDPPSLVHPQLLAAMSNTLEWAKRAAESPGLREVLGRLPAAAGRCMSRYLRPS
jgi:SAM-dependent methyltransferase